MNVQWFPGHMARTRRLLQESLPLVDAVIELRDARAPESSRNPELGAILGAKPRIVLLNKSDLADDGATRRWLAFLRREGPALAVDCRSGRGLSRFAPVVQEALRETIEKNIARGMAQKPLRLMVVGIPNVGKSSLINRLSGGARAKTADKPGVTRQNQWYPAGRAGEIPLELLDTPGVLWPKFDDPAVGEKLAFLGSVKDEVFDIETLAARLLEVLRTGYPARLAERYRLDSPSLPPWELLEAVARRRGMLLPGGAPDTHRAATMLLDELRAGKLGKLTLDKAPQ
jgi:ribosome biogenesis GTPase A